MATFVPNFKPAGNGAGVFPLSTGGPQAINATSATQNYPLGTRIKAIDPVLGEAEFIYAKGVANTAVDDLIQINADYTTVRAAGGTIKGLCGFAQSANVANQFGWYCINGACLCTIAADVTGDVPAYATATAGTVADDIVAGSAVVGSQLLNGTDAAGTAIPNTTDTLAAHKTIVRCHYPYVAKAI
jgi:hypothetical protein